MLNLILKRPRKAMRVAVQLLVSLVLVAWMGWIFHEKGGPQEFHREEWTQRDGFMAIAYSSMTRDGQEDRNSREQFNEHLKALADAGYTSITTDDIIDFYNNKRPLPEKAVYLMMEGGRKDNAIFGQELLAANHNHAAFFTHTGTLSNWSNFFVTYSNVLSISQSPYWDLGSQGYRLTRINEHMDETEPRFFLCDFLRDDNGEKTESDAQMFERLEDFYKKSFEPLAELSSGPKAYIFMPANAFAAFMPGEVEEANQALMRRYFKTSFIREGPAFNSSLDSTYSLSRMRVKPEWSSGELLEAMKSWRPERDRFAIKGPDSALDWVGNITTVEVDGEDILLTPSAGFIDPAMLRGSNLWENMRVSVMFARRDPGERYIYLRYASKDSYLRLTLRSNRLMVHERMPGVGLVNIFDEVLQVREPWKIDVLLRGDRLKMTLNGAAMDPELLPLSATTVRGAVGLAASAYFDYQARFGSLTAESLPITWQNSDNGDIRPPETGKDYTITSRILNLPVGESEYGAAVSNLLQTRAEGNAALATLPEGDMAFSPNRLSIPPLTETQSKKLWSGVVLRPARGADWRAVDLVLADIRGHGLKAVVRLSKDVASELAASGSAIDADYYVLDFAREDLPKPIWTALANRHNRNFFLYRISDNGVESRLYSPQAIK